MQLRFRLRASCDAREVVQSAMLSSLCGSERCKGWQLLEHPGDPGHLLLHVQWEGDEAHEIFRGSAECAEFVRTLGARVRELAEADYRADEGFLLTSLGGLSGMLQFVSDVLQEVSADRWLGARFEGERAARLGLWLIEVLGGPKLYSAASVGELRGGPLPAQPLDVEERAQLLELARNALRIAPGRTHSALGALEANLPLHPALPPPGSLTPVAGCVARVIRLPAPLGAPSRQGR